MHNKVLPSQIHWKWLFAYKDYEHWDLVAKEKFRIIPNSEAYDASDHDQMRLFYNGSDFVLPIGDIIYINSKEDNNCMVDFTWDSICIIATQSIKCGEEITIYYPLE